MERILLYTIFVPLAGAFLLPFAGTISYRLRNWLALCCGVAPFVFSLAMSSSVASGAVVTVVKEFPLGFNLIFAADGLSVFMAAVSSFVSAVIILYSFEYISHYENQNEYYLMVVLFLGAMMGLVYSGNLIFLYLFWEITAFCSWRLIGFFRKSDHVRKADKAFLVTFFGSLVMLAGFLIIYQQTGSFDLSVIKQAFRNNQVSNLALVCILVGIFSKSATLPFQTWLPDAGVAPSPVTALLHAAVLVKIGVYVFARLFIATFPCVASVQVLVCVVAGASALISAGAAFIETDIKRIIAYSTISQIAFIFLGFASGVPIGIAGALLYILMHGLAKGGLFLCAGIVEQKTKIKDITKLGGLAKSMPLTAISFLCCAFSIMGIPPFGGFFSKFMVFQAAAGGAHLFIVVIFLLAAFLTIMYLFRLFNAVFLGEAKCAAEKEGWNTMVLAVLILALLSLVGGILIRYPAQAVFAATQQMLGY